MLLSEIKIIKVLPSTRLRKGYGGMEVQLQAFLTSVPYGDVWYSSRHVPPALSMALAE